MGGGNVIFGLAISFVQSWNYGGRECHIWFGNPLCSELELWGEGMSYLVWQSPLFRVGIVEEGMSYLVWQSPLFRVGIVGEGMSYLVW